MHHRWALERLLQGSPCLLVYTTWFVLTYVLTVTCSCYCYTKPPGLQTPWRSCEVGHECGASSVNRNRSTETGQAWMITDDNRLNRKEKWSGLESRWDRPVPSSKEVYRCGPSAPLDFDRDENPGYQAIFGIMVGICRSPQMVFL